MGRCTIATNMQLSEELDHAANTPIEKNNFSDLHFLDTRPRTIIAYHELASFLYITHGKQNTAVQTLGNSSLREVVSAIETCTVDATDDSAIECSHRTKNSKESIQNIKTARVTLPSPAPRLMLPSNCGSSSPSPSPPTPPAPQAISLVPQ